jgi:GT2 family glycosyltransferase
MIKFGLVTVLYNGVDILDGFFKSLASQTYTNWHLEVIDNSPGEESISHARELAAQYGMSDVNFVRNPENYGVAKGNNQGIQNCLSLNCDYVILLNNDIEFPDANLFSGITAEIGKHGYEILVPKVYYFDTGKLWYGGGRINELSGTVNHFGDRQKDLPEWV